MKTPPADGAGGAGNEQTGSIVPDLSSRNQPAAPRWAEAASLGSGGRASEHGGKLAQEERCVKIWGLTQAPDFVIHGRSKERSDAAQTRG
ncbi:MAG: hypothetical protein EOS30_11940 [Mesorhizobium sp.]|nr:MAG: hypothetical protein EOS30_11940 [Mesorhizobium sp.]